MDITRKQDIETINKGLKSANSTERMLARNAGGKIAKEDGWTRSARERLVKEVRQGNEENAWGIRDDMVKHRGGKMGKGNRGESVSFFFSVPWKK